MLRADPYPLDEIHDHIEKFVRNTQREKDEYVKSMNEFLDKLYSKNVALKGTYIPLYNMYYETKQEYSDAFLNKSPDVESKKQAVIAAEKALTDIFGKKEEDVRLHYSRVLRMRNMMERANHDAQAQISQAVTSYPGEWFVMNGFRYRLVILEA